MPPFSSLQAWRQQKSQPVIHLLICLCVTLGLPSCQGVFPTSPSTPMATRRLLLAFLRVACSGQPTVARPGSRCLIANPHTPSALWKLILMTVTRCGLEPVRTMRSAVSRRVMVFINPSMAVSLGPIWGSKTRVISVRFGLIRRIQMKYWSPHRAHCGAMVVIAVFTGRRTVEAPGNRS